MYRYGKKEVANAKKIVASGSWFRYYGGKMHCHAVDEFEKKMKSYTGARYVLATSSCTGALVSALAAIGVGPQDEVIIPGYTFVATAAAVVAIGAVPVIAEIDETHTIDVFDIKRKITPRTKAIIPVHLTGNPVFMPDLMNLHLHTGTYEISPYVIEDAAQAVDAEIYGKKVGGWGVAGEFSFHPLKNLNVVNGVNSDYSNNITEPKNCYLCFNAGYVEDCMYSHGMSDCRNCVDVSHLSKCETCYDSFWLTSGTKNIGCNNCESSLNLWFSKNCVGCSDCLGCVGLRNKQYHIWNQPYSKEEYQTKLNELNLGSYEGYKKIKSQAQDFWVKFPNKFIEGTHNTNVSGNYISHSNFIYFSAYEGDSNSFFCLSFLLFIYFQKKQSKTFN